MRASRLALVLVLVVGWVATVGHTQSRRSADVVQPGVGIGQWRFGMKWRRFPGLNRSERYPGREGPGCIGGTATASRIDYYPEYRALWWIDGKRSGLYGIATMKMGDRDRNGFTIGRSRFAAVRSRYPKAELSRRIDRYSLGTTSLSRYRKTGYESGEVTTYWFDADSLLVAIELSGAGC